MNRRIVPPLVFWICLFFLAFDSQARSDAAKLPAKVSVEKDAKGAWRMRVDGESFFVKGVVFAPVKPGESPHLSTMRDWMTVDDNRNGVNDIAFESWLDTDRNAERTPQDEVIGDFELLRRMGANAIRVYHAPSDNPILGDLYQADRSMRLQFDHPINKAVLRRLHADYGIRVMIGNFLGAWTIGSGVERGGITDYTNPVHRENIKKSVRAMVLDNRDEPYTLLWVLGNANIAASWSRCNAAQEPEAYAKLVGELAAMIHELDPNHPVAVSEGDTADARRLALYREHAPQIDILCVNSTAGSGGLGALWKEIKRTLDRPVIIGEFGMFAYNKQNGEDDEQQFSYIQSAWRDIVRQSAHYYNPDQNAYSGNSIGGVVYDWADRWYMDGSPAEHSPGVKYLPTSPDQLDHGEWFGLMSFGDGTDPLMRWPRKAYHYLSRVWNRSSLSYE